MDGPEFRGGLNEQFLQWLAAVPLDSMWTVVVLDLLAAAAVLHALRLRRRNYRWWGWSLPLCVVLLGLSSLAALNAETSTFPTLGSLVA